MAETTKQTPMISLWKGKKIEDLSKEELIKALTWCGGKINELQTDNARWMKAADPMKYLRNKG